MNRANKYIEIKKKYFSIFEDNQIFFDFVLFGEINKILNILAARSKYICWLYMSQNFKETQINIMRRNALQDSHFTVFSRDPI